MPPTMKYTIKIEENNKHNIRIETAEDFSSSYFSNIYRNAARSILNLYCQRKKREEYEEENSENKCKKEMCYCEPVNNIIVFSGERGSGKSSALASFVQELKIQEMKKVSSGNGDQDIICKFKDLHEKMEFYVMKTMDPSHFTPEKNILFVIISTLFLEFSEKNSSANTKDASLAKKIYKKFEKALKAIQNIDIKFTGKIAFDSLEILDELGSSLDLKSIIHDLVIDFIDYVKPNAKYLVIPIDDLDMNVDHAFEMLEMIRKFLIQDNIIIMMAASINQLHLELEEQFYDYYEKMINTRNAANTRKIDVKKMASGYMSKIIPPSRRLEIPHLDIDFKETKLIINKVDDNNRNNNDNNDCNNNGNKYDNINGNNKENNSSDNEGETLQKTILRMIWEKTGLIFVPEDNQLHPIIPTNMRALHQLVFLLVSMKKTKLMKNILSEKDKENESIMSGKTIKDNFYKFKDYIMKYWIPFHLASRQQDVFENLPANINRINKYLLQSINAVGNQFKEKIVLKEVELENRFPDADLKKMEEELHKKLNKLEECF